MNHIDAAKILGLSGESDPRTVKKAYRKASALYHPDRNPAGEEMMKAVNEAYETLKDFTGNLHSNNEDYGSHLSEALNSLAGLSGLIIEICGSWVWVTGETKEHKETLKTAGFKWARQKKAWYLKPEDDNKRYRGTSSMSEIRQNHGTRQFTFNQTRLAS